MTSPTATIIGSNMLPRHWTLAQDILNSNSNEAHRLLLYLLDKVHAGTLALSNLGVHNATVEEEINFVAKLESIARFAMLAERFELDFGLDRQMKAFGMNDDLADLASDLGMTVQRADLPWALDMIGLDARLRRSFQLPEHQLPLDILFTISSRVRDWYEELVGTSLAQHGRGRVFDSEEVQEFAKKTLQGAYDTYDEEMHHTKDEALARDAVRCSMGMAS